MRVGIFGGSFNPPHIAHLVVAELVREEFALDEVVWILSPRPPHKDPASLAPADHRLAMVRLAIEGNPYFRLSDLEIRREGPSYTIETLRILRAERPNAEFYLIMGGDSLADFESWKEPEAILEEAQLIVYDRTGTRPMGRLAESVRVRHASAPCMDLSSSELRKRIRGRMSTRYLVPQSVRDYISSQGLYGSTRGSRV